MPLYRVQHRPKLEDVAGKFMVVSQFGEPKRWNSETDEFDYAAWVDLDEIWWRSVCPDIFETRTIHWGHSTWLINHDGTLAFSGAEYDSSG